MMRPRNILIAACPWLSNNDASQVLRNAGGDIEKAKRQAMQARKDAADGKKNKKAEHNQKANVDGDNSGKLPALPAREPPRHSVSINNLSDRQYCCVWSVEVYEDGYVSVTVIFRVHIQSNVICKKL